MSDSLRMRRVSELIRQSVAEILSNEIDDPKVKDVVITEVKVTKDLSIAKIFFTTYNRKELGTIKKALVRTTGYLHKRLTKLLHLKRVPKIEFLFDEVEQYGAKIEALIKENSVDLNPICENSMNENSTGGSSVNVDLVDEKSVGMNSTDAKSIVKNSTGTNLTDKNLVKEKLIDE